MTKLAFCCLLMAALVGGLMAGACAKPAPSAPSSTAPSSTPSPAAAKPASSPAPAPKPAPAPASTGTWPKEIRIISASVGTENFGMDSTIAAALSKRGITCTAFPGSSEANVGVLNDGEAEFSMTTGSYPGPAWKGEKPYKKPHTSIRFMFNRGASMTACFVRADSKIKTLRDLIGKKVAFGPKASSVELLGRSQLEAAGITFEQIKAAGGVTANMSYQAMGEGLVDGSLDAIWLNTPPAAVHQSLVLANERFGVRLLPLPEDALAKALKGDPSVTKGRIKGGTYSHSPEDMYYAAAPIPMLCRADLAEDLVYRVMKIVYEPEVSKEIVSKFPMFGLLGDTEDGLQMSQIIPMHPGAAKFWRDDRRVDLKARGITVQ